jgi:hypothetical protein
MSVFSGLSRPLKAAGLALIAVAVAAAIVGGVTVLNSGNSSDTASPGSPPSSGSPHPTSSSAPSGPSSPASSTTPPPPSSSAPSGTPSSPGSPPPSQSGGVPNPGQPGGGQPDPAKLVTVRVYNNSTIKGLAARAATDFRAQGWTVAEVSNYADGIIPATTAYYRPGTDEETAAKALAAEFGIRADARFDGIAQSSPGVIVIVTNNYQPGGGKPGS